METVEALFTAFFILVSCKSASQAAAADPLQVRFSNAKLPIATDGLRAVYDGDDRIYIVGGSQNVINISRYSISADTLEDFGEFIPISEGAVIFYHQDIIYLGGQSKHFQIYRYSTVTRKNRLVYSVPRGLQRMASAWDPENEWLYLFGGVSGIEVQNEILQYNPKNNDIKKLGTVSRWGLTGAAVWYTGRALIFADDMNESYVLEFNPVNGNVSRWPSTATGELSRPSAVMTASGQPYVFGGQTWARYNPWSKTAEKVHVSGLIYMDSTGCVYVSALDRIYIFGGAGIYSGTNYAYRDEITYVDLGTPIPTTPTGGGTTDEDCSDGETKLIPNSFCCESFFMCHRGIATKLQCLEPLHFNPQTTKCDAPEVVGCKITHGAN